MKVSFIHKITKVIVDISFFIGIGLVILVPFLVNWWYTFNTANKYSVISATIFLIISGIFGIIILWFLRKILKSVIDRNVFNKENVQVLRYIGLSTFIISILYFLKLFVDFGFGTIIVAIAFFLATLFILTMKDVFKQAISFKEENDWTI